MIEIFPSKLAGGPLEVHQTAERMTLEQWLRAKVPSFEHRDAPPISISVNGFRIPHACWESFRFRPEDQVAIYIEPAGGELVVAAVTLQAAVKFATGLFMPKMPSMPSQNTAQGDKLALASAKGNKVKINSPIREIAGRRKVYPDYLLPERRYFGEPDEAWVEMLLCIGKGKYQITATDIQVGDTPIIALGEGAEYAIYQPGADLSAEPAAIWWHSSSEVGSTSSGTAGLHLKNTFDVQDTPNDATYVFSGFSITIPSGAGQYPEGWAAGMIARIESHLPYTVIDGGSSQNIIKGDFSELEPFAGMVIEVVGANEGQYVINSYTPYSPSDPGAPGSPASITGNAAPSRYDFDVTPVSFDVAWGGATFTVNLTTNQSDLAGLLSTINSALGASGLIAQDDGAGKVKITESVSPYAGESLAVSGDTVDIFGASPVIVAGSETVDPTPEQPAQITLSYPGGEPVTELQTGQLDMTIGYSGLRYRLTAASASAIIVDRLTDTGATDTGWGGFIGRTDPEASIFLDGSSTEGAWCGPFVACPNGETTSELEIDIMFTRGLGWINRKGKLQSHSVTAEWQYRDFDTGGVWTSVTRNFRNSTLNQIGYTERITLPYAMRPEIRLRRIGAEYSETVALERMEWFGLRARLQGPTSYPGVTTIAMRIRGGSRLASQSEQLVSVTATRVLPVRNGGAWDVETPTRNIAPWLAYVAHSIGYTDDDLDLDELDRLDAIWSARGDYFDAAVDAVGTVKESINDALLAGFAELTIDRGRIRPVRDEPRTTFEHLYTLQNMTEGLSRQFSAMHLDDYEGVDVEYVDGISWQKETVECRIPGDIGRRVEKLKLEGVTSRTRAWRIGMRRRMEQKYRRWQYSWGTELDALNSRYLSYCAVADDVPGYGQSALLLSYAPITGGYLLESSEPLDWSAGGDHVVALRRPDGTLSGPYTATRVDDYRLTVPALDFAPDTSWQIEPAHLLFGPLNRWSYPVLITSISPSGDGASVEAVGYDPRIYTYDDATPA
ncbi:host specificity factor TipJ family phage tail protein [Azotobacter salinestris]|uniref:host specificity factor TipJ family phage tail protein n=1 Tax=Azotobacter salinestris TaxID=69964 RepID=UPI0032DE8FE7